MYQEVTGTSLPRTAKEMSSAGTRVGARESRRAISCSSTPAASRIRTSASISAYYCFVHAPSRGGEVEIARLSLAHWQKRYDGARRLIAVPVTTAATPYARDPADATP